MKCGYILVVYLPKLNAPNFLLTKPAKPTLDKSAISDRSAIFDNLHGPKFIGHQNACMIRHYLFQMFKSDGRPQQATTVYLEATTGHLEANSGHLEASSGYFEASSGHFEASSGQQQATSPPSTSASATTQAAAAGRNTDIVSHKLIRPISSFTVSVW